MQDSIRIKTSLLLYEIDECIKDDLAHTEAHKLPIVAIYVLNELYYKDSQRTSDLAAAVGNMSSSFSWIVNRLEDEGFVARVQNANDRRSPLVCLTAKGSKVKNAIRAAIANAEVRYGGG